MEIINITEVEGPKNADVDMKTVFAKEGVTMGTVVIPPGIRAPLKGAGSHEGDEYSIILKGSLLTESGGKQYRVSAGQATFIPAGEAHWALNDGTEDCEIIWTLVKS